MWRDGWWVEQVGNSKRKWFLYQIPKQGDQKIQLRVVQQPLRIAALPDPEDDWKNRGVKGINDGTNSWIRLNVEMLKDPVVVSIVIIKTMCQKSIGIRYNQQMEIIKRLKSQTYITWKSNVSWALLHCWQTDHDDSDGGRDPWEFLMIRPGGFAWFSTTKPNYQISWRNVLLETWTS